jgi:hypothetical protein
MVNAAAQHRSNIIMGPSEHNEDVTVVKGLTTRRTWLCFDDLDQLGNQEIGTFIFIYLLLQRWYLGMGSVLFHGGWCEMERNGPSATVHA